MSDSAHQAHPGSRRVMLPLDLSGDAVSRLRQSLMAAITDGTGGPVEVDAQNVAHLDVTALAVLVAADRAARSHGSSLQIVHPNWLMLRRLHETGLDHVLKV